jgi:hypothetical protein
MWKHGMSNEEQTLSLYVLVLNGVLVIKIIDNNPLRLMMTFKSS